MSAPHVEINLETEIVDYLKAPGRGWVEGNAKNYSKELALYPDDVIEWIKRSQPDLYAKVMSNHNGSTDGLLLKRLRESINKRGALHVLRNGFAHVGLNRSIRMCAFRPDSSRNADETVLHNKVILRVVRQVYYSKSNNNSIDLVFFINGIPIATSELKTDFTQDVNEAITEYKTRRLPKDPTSKLEEPLLKWKTGAIVHFAVSDEEIYMTTQLDGADTRFLPFNMGDDGAAGNPINPTSDAKTSYFWERILERETCLDIIGRFVHLESKQVTRDDGRRETRETIVFPRFHQWDAVTRLTEDAREKGPGHEYLIQHSAGSGKSNSIMWLAHRLASLHNDKDEKVFHSVVVLTDRNVLDTQLQGTIAGYAHAAGLVKPITSKGDAKSTKLAEALQSPGGIIVVTLQTFPFVLKQLEDAKKLQGKAYAVIADEAHSSQTGEDAKELREILGLSEDEPEAIIDAEDVLAAKMAKRAASKNLSFFAFTATPKAKTIDIFGTIGPDGKKRPFHTYTMQQAIQEGFILDVLQNYTTFKFAYKLATGDPKAGDKVVPKSETAKIISRYVRLHDTNVAQRIAIIVEHFRESVQHLLSGKAKAMIVCDSRKAAVKYKIAIDKYIAEQKYRNLKTLVAFSGEIVDEGEWPGQKFTESSMNRIPSAAIPEEFATDEYQVLLVAEKFQTGFDQPLLSAMYVNKKLAGINAVQTLSRLNRTYKRGPVEKTTTYVLDFVNDASDILDAFKPFFRDAYLIENADPNQILDIQATLDALGIYGQEDVDRFIEAYVTAIRSKNASHTKLKGALDPVVKRYHDWVAAAKASKNDEEVEKTDLFRKNMIEFVRAYNFLSQIYNYGDTEVEKRSLFYSHLARLIHQDRDEAIVDASAVFATHIANRKTFEGRLSLMVGQEGVKPTSAIGNAKARQKQYGPLAEIVTLLNELFGSEIKEEDKIALLLPFDTMMDGNETVRTQAEHNDVEQFLNAGDFSDALKGSLLEAQDTVEDNNAQQTEVIKEMVGRLFADHESLDRFMRAYGTYYHRKINTEKRNSEQGFA
ncbi:MAG TPA: type I restriction endonuclease [Candidatus Baltobacteraceae bacterium]|nr:type I restriction endonuclease [Candidatus Baltobacteraceae bacterium]